MRVIGRRRKGGAAWLAIGAAFAALALAAVAAYAQAAPAAYAARLHQIGDSKSVPCEERSVPTKLRSISSVAWSARTSTAILIDGHADPNDRWTSKEVTLDAAGGLVAERITTGRENKIAATIEAGDRNLEILSPWEVRWRDADRKNAEARINLAEATGQLALKGQSEYKVGALYSWEMAPGGELFANGLVIDSTGAFLTGFFSLTLPQPGSSGPVSPVRFIQYSSYEYYTIEYPYMASLGRYVYFLQLERNPTLYRYDTRIGIATPLRGFPGESTELPVLRTTSGNVQDILKSIENYDLPVGLFSDERAGGLGLVYSLHRRPGPKPGTYSWRMYQIKPSYPEVEVLGEMRIPSQAYELAVLQTPENWLFFQKGPVLDEKGTQDISTMLIIPAELVRQNDSPFYAPESAHLKCASKQ